MREFIKTKGIFIILALGFLLRIISINQSFWLDEATSGIVARDFSFSEIVSVFSPRDFHPPLYYIILKTWSLVFGNGEISLRSLSIVSGLISIYALYLISKELNYKNLFIAPILLATSGLHIYYSQEARMYSLATLFVALSVLFFVKLVKEGEGRVGEWFLFSLFLALSVATHYLAILIIPVFFLFGLLKKTKFNWWKKFLTSHIILIIFAVLWSPILIKQLSGGINVGSTSPLWAQVLGKFSIKEILLVPIKFTLGRISIDNNLLYALVAVVIYLSAGWLLFIGIASFKNKTIIWLWLFLPILIGVFLSLKVPLFSYFRFLFVLPAFYLILAEAILINKNKKFWFGLILSVNLISSVYYLGNSKFHREDWRALSNFIEENRNSNSQVLFVANSQMEGYKYYFPNAKIQGPESFDAEVSEVWLLGYVKDIFDPEDKLKNKIEQSGYVKIDEYNFNGIPVYKYKKNNYAYR